MAMDIRTAASSKGVVATNVFELCALKTLSWRVYTAAQSESDDAATQPTKQSPETTRDALNAFAAFAGALKQQPNALYAWQTVAAAADTPLDPTRDHDDDDDDDADDRLWVFSVNHAQKMPTASAAAAVKVVGSGEWTAMSVDALAVDVQQRLFRALHVWIATKLLVDGAFRLEKELFTRNEARFVYRTPSLSRANHFDVYLDEDFDLSGFQLHFELLPPTQTLCVNVQMLHRSSSSSMNSELGNVTSSWLRLLGLPREDDHSMVDVWHSEHSLAARVVAETKYEGVYPQFCSVPRQKRKRRNGGDGGSGGDGFGGGAGDGGEATGKGGDRFEDHDDDEADGGADGDADGTRNGNGAGNKKRRRKALNDALENDESVVPVSPDTHVNSPDASGPVVHMTFPRDNEPLLHADSEIHVYMRRRRKTKDQTSGGIAFGPLLTPVLSATATRTSIPILGRVRSGSVSQRPETPKPPALSLAVSLVASLTQDEQQEVLECKPVKSHPLLQALDAFVENEMRVQDISTASTTSSSVERGVGRLVPNAPAFSPSIDERKTTKRSVESYLDSDHLRSRLLSDRFSRYLTGYYPRDFRRNKRQQRREHERKLLLEYDEAKLTEYARTKATATTTTTTTTTTLSICDSEIAIGIHLAALDALVPWRLHGKASKRWTPHASYCRTADEHDMLALACHVTPFLTQLQAVVKGKSSSGVASEITADDETGEVHDPWMSLAYYSSRINAATADDDDAARAVVPLDAVPRLCVSTLESSLQVEIPAISEYALRNFQPVAAAKPIDYAVVCPTSPSQWLGMLTLSYLAMLRSVYAPTSMGDQVAMDLSGLDKRATVGVDAANAMLLVDCATSSDDAFATYRAAGELLRPLLAQGTKRKQAFSRSAVANVVFLVAPFRKADIKHKLWLLGAFGRGLFGDTQQRPDWAGSVTLELLYLEDLVDVGVGADPHALLPAAMALYDRVFERVSLKPVVPSGDNAAKSRFVCERLYHLADPPTSDEATTTTMTTTTTGFVHAGYALSTDRKWLLASFTDAVGAVLETKVFPVAVATGDDLSTALLSFVQAAFEFAALLGGEKTTLAVTQLGAFTGSEEIWRQLTSTATKNDAFQQLTSRYVSVVAKILICQASFVANDRVQVRPSTAAAASVALCGEKDALLVIRPDDATQFQARSRVANVKWLRSAAHRPTHETAVLRVQLLHSVDVEEAPESLSVDSVLAPLLANWSSLSYLTTHPVSLERQSPLPLHLVAVDELHSELEMLERHMATDPLTLRR